MQKKSIAIVSNHLSGLILAAALKAEGHEVTLVDTNNEPRSADRWVRLGLPFYADTPEFKAGLRLLEQGANQTLTTQNEECPPLLWQEGELRPFVGFGDSKSSAVQALTYYNQTQRLRLSFSPEELIFSLSGLVNIKTLPFCEVSNLVFEDAKLKTLVVNGSQEINADEFVFLNSPRELMPLLPAEFIGSRARSRIMKSALYSKVSLEFKHEAALTTDENLIFFIPNQADQPPFVGRAFMQPGPTGVTYASVWETYIPSELSEDTTAVVSILKNIRKQVRRAYPHLEEKLNETLDVTPVAAGDFNWWNDQYESLDLPENLIVQPQLAATTLGFVQCVECVYRAYSRLENRWAQVQMPNEKPSPSLLT